MHTGSGDHATRTPTVKPKSMAVTHLKQNAIIAQMHEATVEPRVLSTEAVRLK